MPQIELTGGKLLLIRSPSSSGRQEICALTGTGKNVVENVNGKTINHSLNSVIHCSLRVYSTVYDRVVSLIRNDNTQMNSGKFIIS